MSVISKLSLRERSEQFNIVKPREIACYSRKWNDEIVVNSDENLRYYHFPDSDIAETPSLSQGRKDFKDFRSQIDDICSLEGLLKTIQCIEKSKNAKAKANIITFRGIIRKLISAAFETSKNPNSIDLRVIIYDNQLFIKEIATKDQKQNDAIDLSTFSGYKFETLTTLDKPSFLCTRKEIENRPLEEVNNGDEYVTIVGTGIGQCRMILGAEVDGIFDFKDDLETANNLPHYLELKCTRAVYSERDAYIFGNKLFRTWLQCFLVGIPKIIYGFRDENYKLTSIEEYSTEEIPNLIKLGNGETASSCVESIKWYGKITEWLMSILERYNKKNEPDTIVPFRLTLRDKELQLIEINERDEEYDKIVNHDMIISNDFKAWRRELREKTERK